MAQLSLQIELHLSLPLSLSVCARARVMISIGSSGSGRGKSIIESSDRGFRSEMDHDLSRTRGDGMTMDLRYSPTGKALGFLSSA